MPDSPDPAALLRRLEELKQSYRDSCTIEDVRSLDNALHDLLATDLIPVVRRAVELEGENARLNSTNGYEVAAEWRDKFKRAELHLSVARACAAVALESLGITPGPDPVQELCGVVPGMVAKLREACKAGAETIYQCIHGDVCPDFPADLDMLIRAQNKLDAALARETTNGR